MPFSSLECEGHVWTLVQESTVTSPALIRINVPQAAPSKLAIATLNVPLPGVKGAKQRNEDWDDMATPIAERPGSPVTGRPPPFQRKDSATTTAGKRRALVSLNSFTNLAGPSSENRPKNSIKPSSSSLFTRTENLPSSQTAATKNYITVAQGLASPGAFGHQLKVAFWATGKILSWTELVAAQPAPTNNPRLHFTQTITALTLNHSTCSHTSMDLLIGFSTGDIVWLDPLTTRYNRFNKAGVATTSAVTALAWCPNYRSTASNPALTFLSCHADGTVMTWSTDKDDPQPSSVIIPPSHAWSEQADMLVEVNVPVPNGSDKKGSAARTNPVQIWRLSRKGLTDVAVAPDGRFAAFTSDDGRLRIVSLDQTRLLDTYCSYFGAFTCCAWSPDGRFILTGGQDDLVSIWSPSEQRLLARCQGHNSFVTDIAFEDISLTESSRRVPRFSSIGEDCRVIFWDLSGAALHRPKAAQAHSNRRISLSSTLSLNTLSRKRTSDSQAHLPMEDLSEYAGPVFHPASPRSEVSILQPVMASPPADELLSGLSLSRDVVLLTRTGNLRFFALQPSNNNKHRDWSSI